jgi:hypothetical protein
MRTVMTQLAGLSARKAAAELNRRKIASATGTNWYAATVIKLRDRLEASGMPEHGRGRARARVRGGGSVTARGLPR